MLREHVCHQCGGQPPERRQRETRAAPGGGYRAPDGIHEGQEPSPAFRGQRYGHGAGV